MRPRAIGSEQIQVVHAKVPGRMRLAVPGLKHNAKLAKRLQEALLGKAGIRLVKANPVTGTVLVHFPPDQPQADVVAAVAANADLPAPVAFGKQRPTRQAPGATRAPGWRDLNGVSWHALPLDEIAEKLGISIGDAERGGLTSAQVRAHLKRYGPNILERIPPRSDARILIDQFANLPTGVLGASAALSALTAAPLDAAAILAVIAANTAIGFTTERGAERTIDALGAMEHPGVRVRRDGRVATVPAEDLVPGDLVELIQGSLVAADGRVVAAEDLSVDESALTGESLPVAKRAGALDNPGAPLGDRDNMVHRGTAVTGGSGRARVVATGADTEVGRIQALVGAAAPGETPLQKQLGRVGRQLIGASFAACGAVLAIGLVRGQPPLQLLKTAVSLGVAAMPEGLPTVATVTLALGIQTMRRHKVLVRRLDAVETLGSVGVMCFDKTGTLTENRISPVTVITPVREIAVGRDGLSVDGAPLSTPLDAAADRDLSALLRIAVLCNDASIAVEDGRNVLRGSGTEKSLIELALSAGLDVAAMKRDCPAETTEYRTLSRRYMTTRHADGDDRIVAIKGAPADVLKLCGTVSGGEGGMRLTRTRRERILRQNEELAGRGLRVLGFASSRQVPGAAPESHTWMGLVGLVDPTRSGMPELMRTFHAAGIRTVMITGDQGATAYAVARDLNLAQGGTVEVLEGSELEETDPELLAALAKTTHVFARVSPANKLQIVEALQRGGAIVAMTGDGINDSPALRKADIGVAMGSGSEAAHQVAEIVLDDDRIETMPVAVAHGRSTYANIRKALRFLLSTNLSEILVTLAATAIGRGTPLTPIQLLWINLVTDVFPALALSLDPPEADVMSRPPRNPAEPILRRADFSKVAIEGGLFTAAALASRTVGTIRYGPGLEAQGMTFTTLTVSQLLHALSSRSETRSLLAFGKRAPNRHLRRAVTGLMALQAVASLLPPTRRFLGLGRLRPADFLIASGFSLAPMLAIEAAKLFRPAPTDAADGPEDTS